MINLKTMTEFDEEIKGIKADYEMAEEEYKQSLNELQKEVDEAQANEQQAKKKMYDTKQGDNPKEYAEAVADHRTAKDITEFYVNKIEEMKEESSINGATHREYTKRIKDGIQDMNTETERRAKELLTELNALAPNLVNRISTGEELLKELNIARHGKPTVSIQGALDVGSYDTYHKLKDVNQTYGATSIVKGEK